MREGCDKGLSRGSLQKNLPVSDRGYPKQMGLTIPDSVLFRADKVIK